jgi:hypothetical protein
MVCSPRYEYGGTADAFVEIDGEIWLLDYKTRAGVYPDTALQLAGLARAQFMGRPGDPTQYPVPFATRFGVLHIRPEGARLLPVVVNTISETTQVHKPSGQPWRDGRGTQSSRAMRQICLFVGSTTSPQAALRSGGLTQSADDWRGSCGAPAR